MASLLVRTATYQFAGQDRSVRLKKWSADKFLTLIGVIGEVVEGALSQFDLSDALDVRKIGLLLVSQVGNAKDKIVRIIVESLDETPPVTAQEVLSWDPEDFVGLLHESLRLNLTETLGKKVLGLRDLASQPPS